MLHTPLLYIDAITLRHATIRDGDYARCHDIDRRDTPYAMMPLMPLLIMLHAATLHAASGA